VIMYVVQANNNIRSILTVSNNKQGFRLYSYFERYTVGARPDAAAMLMAALHLHVLVQYSTVQYSTVLYTVQYNLHCQSLARSEAARSSPLDRESAEQMCNGKTNARETAKWDAPCYRAQNVATAHI
jgi:hypothetical protein